MGHDAIDDALRFARLRWPAIRLSDEHYRAYVADRPGAHHVVDLYLACGCAAGDPAALAGFETEIITRLPAMLTRHDATIVGEARSILYERLFTGTAPRITTYNGTVELKNWVCVVANRIAMDLGRRAGAATRRAADALDTVAETTDDPQLTFLKATYRAELAEAFREAAETLSPEQRNLLRFHVVDRLTSDEVGAVYRVHRATAARWIERARDTLIARTRRRLLARLRVDAAELESILRIVRSRLDVSLNELLASKPR
ncbi:MAG: sigma-70 family RNA polymerase sigma factor [Kofleriaceae bacterium]|nr:sigma-70 family RNA polymerase sigma factor [Kofleriaceae bacterium]